MDWTDCEFIGRDFRDDDLSRLRTERVVFTECDFSGGNLGESEHLGSAFRNRTLALDEVDFTLTALGGNDLRGIDFSGCRPREANLVEADLRKTVLRGAVVDPSLWTTASLTRARIDIE